MATTGTAILTLTVTGDTDTAGTSTFGPDQLSQAAAVPAEQKVTLVPGNNTITIPAGSTFMKVTLPSGNANAVILKGVGTDGAQLNLGTTGLACALQVNGWTTFVLNNTGGTNIANVLVRSQ